METGKDKVRKICEALRKETLEPSKKEAEEILEAAVAQAESILADAQMGAEKILLEARQEIQRQKNIYEASLSQGCKQALQALKQNIEKKLFNPQLSELLSKSLKEPEILARLITAIIGGIEKEGIEADLSVLIPKTVSARSINELLGKQITERLREKGVSVGPISGGIEVRMHQDNLTIDLTDSAIKELVSQYIRKDFQDLLFGKSEFWTREQ